MIILGITGENETIVSFTITLGPPRAPTGPHGPSWGCRGTFVFREFDTWISSI